MLAGVQLPFHRDLAVPQLRHVKLDAPTGTPVGDIRSAAANAIKGQFDGKIRVGATVAVGAGSRGLTGRVEMLAGTIDGLRSPGR